MRATLTISELATAIRYLDPFAGIPAHLHVRTCDVQRTIRADWESYIGNPDRKVRA